MKAIKVAVLAARCYVSATMPNVLATPHSESATLCGVLAALRTMLALPDSYENSRGAWGYST